MVTILTDLAQLMEQAYVESIRAAMINGNYSNRFSSTDGTSLCRIH